MLAINSFQAFQETCLGGRRSLRRDDDALPVGCHLQRRIHVDIENLKESLIQYQGGAVAVPGELLCHELTVFTTCIRGQARRRLPVSVSGRRRTTVVRLTYPCAVKDCETTALNESATRRASRRVSKDSISRYARTPSVATRIRERPSRKYTTS